ncbi:hypothetical protein Tco_0186340 [Tanacetum coccineum]
MEMFSLFKWNLLKKYEIFDSSLMKTPMVPPNNLGPDLAGKPVNETSYREWMGSLIYEEILRLLKGTPTCLYIELFKLDLTGYSVSDLLVAILDKDKAPKVPLLAYCLITGTEDDIWEIHLQLHLRNQLLNSTRLKYASYLDLSHGPEASRALSKKRQKLKSKKPPTKTQVTPPKPTRVLSNPTQSPWAPLNEDNWENHEEVVVNYADLKASIDEYYDENIAHRDQTDKLVEASMCSLDKSSNTISDLYKGFNIITDAHPLKQDEELAAWAKYSTNMAWNLGSRLSGLERAQNYIQSSIVTLTLALTHILSNVEGENDSDTATEDPPSYTERETDANK